MPGKDKNDKLEFEEKIQNLISGKKKVMAWMESLGTGI